MWDDTAGQTLLLDKPEATKGVHVDFKDREESVFWNDLGHKK